MASGPSMSRRRKGTTKTLRADMRAMLMKAIEQEEGTMRVLYSFLPAPQIRGKVLTKLGIPHFCGDIQWSKIGPDLRVSIPTRVEPVPPPPDPAAPPRRFFNTPRNVSTAAAHAIGLDFKSIQKMIRRGLCSPVVENLDSRSASAHSARRGSPKRGVAEAGPRGQGQSVHCVPQARKAKRKLFVLGDGDQEDQPFEPAPATTRGRRTSRDQEPAGDKSATSVRSRPEFAHKLILAERNENSPERMDCDLPALKEHAKRTLGDQQARAPAAKALGKAKTLPRPGPPPSETPGAKSSQDSCSWPKQVVNFVVDCSQTSRKQPSNISQMVDIDKASAQSQVQEEHALSPAQSKRKKRSLSLRKKGEVPLEKPTAEKSGGKLLSVHLTTSTSPAERTSPLPRPGGKLPSLHLTTSTSRVERTSAIRPSKQGRMERTSPPPLNIVIVKKVTKSLSQLALEGSSRRGDKGSLSSSALEPSSGVYNLEGRVDSQAPMEEDEDIFITQRGPDEATRQVSPTVIHDDTTQNMFIADDLETFKDNPVTSETGAQENVPSQEDDDDDIYSCPTEPDERDVREADFFLAEKLPEAMSVDSPPYCQTTSGKSDAWSPGTPATASKPKPSGQRSGRRGSVRRHSLTPDEVSGVKRQLFCNEEEAPLGESSPCETDEDGGDGPNLKDLTQRYPAVMENSSQEDDNELIVASFTQKWPAVEPHSSGSALLNASVDPVIPSTSSKQESSTSSTHVSLRLLPVVDIIVSTTSRPGSSANSEGVLCYDTEELLSALPPQQPAGAAMKGGSHGKSSRPWRPSSRPPPSSSSSEEVPTPLPRPRRGSLPPRHGNASLENSGERGPRPAEPHAPLKTFTSSKVSDATTYPARRKLFTSTPINFSSESAHSPLRSWLNKSFTSDDSLPASPRSRQSNTLGVDTPTAPRRSRQSKTLFGDDPPPPPRQSNNFTSDESPPTPPCSKQSKTLPNSDGSPPAPLRPRQSKNCTSDESPPTPPRSEQSKTLSNSDDSPPAPLRARQSKNCTSDDSPPTPPLSKQSKTLSNSEDPPPAPLRSKQSKTLSNSDDSPPVPPRSKQSKTRSKQSKTLSNSDDSPPTPPRFKQSKTLSNSDDSPPAPLRPRQSKNCTSDDSPPTPPRSKQSKTLFGDNPPPTSLRSRQSKNCTSDDSPPTPPRSRQSRRDSAPPHLPCAPRTLPEELHHSDEASLRSILSDLTQSALNLNLSSQLAVDAPAPSSASSSRSRAAGSSSPARSKMSRSLPDSTSLCSGSDWPSTVETGTVSVKSSCSDRKVFLSPPPPRELARRTNRRPNGSESISSLSSLASTVTSSSSRPQSTASVARLNMLDGLRHRTSVGSSPAVDEDEEDPFISLSRFYLGGLFEASDEDIDALSSSVDSENTVVLSMFQN